MASNFPKTTNRSLSDADLTNVSGLYGPGAYLAWYITSLSVSVATAFHATSTPPNSRHDKLDADIIAVAAYPIIAAGDIFIRSNRPPIDAAAMAAAVHVVLLGASISCICVFHTSMAAISPAPMRCLIWTFTWVICLAAWGRGMQFGLDKPSFIFHVISFYTFFTLFFHFSLSLRQNQKPTLIGGLSRIFMLTIFPGLVQVPFTREIPAPLSEAKLRDLDQAAALGTALLGISGLLYWRRRGDHQRGRDVKAIV